jgi:hypothetical protein
MLRVRLSPMPYARRIHRREELMLALMRLARLLATTVVTGEDRDLHAARCQSSRTT